MSTILLVEDNPHIMKINAEALSMYGYEILQAATARECRQALRWHPVDLVVLDIMLPDGDGVKLCRELKEQYHTPILFLSALGESRDVVEGLRAGGGCSARPGIRIGCRPSAASPSGCPGRRSAAAPHPASHPGPAGPGG